MQYIFKKVPLILSHKMTECHSYILYMNILKLSMPKVYLKFLSSDLYIS